MEFQIGMGIYEPWIPDTQDGFNLFPQDPLDNSQPLGPLFDFGSPGDHFSGDDVPGLDNILGQPDYTITASSVTSRLEPWQDEFNLLAQDHPDNNQSLGAIFDFGSPGDHISSDDLPGLDNILGRPDHTIVSHPAPSVPSRLDPAITFCALYINSRGEILGIHPDPADERVCRYKLFGNFCINFVRRLRSPHCISSGFFMAALFYPYSYVRFVIGD